MTERADSQSQDHTTSLEHYLAPLRDHKKVILLVTAATLALGALVALAGPQRYTARTSVLIYPVAAGPTEALQGAERSDDMSTELRIAESRAVAEMTAAEFDTLGIDVDTADAAAAITVANPEDSRVLTISYQASEPATARVGSELAAAAYLAYRSELNAASRQVARTSINDEIAVLQDRLTVAEEQLARAGAGSSARLVAEVELASVDAELEAQQQALADLSTLSIDAATVFDEASEPTSADGLGSAQLLVGALAGGLVLGVIAAWTMAALGLPSGSLRPARTIGASNRSDDDGGSGDDGDEPSDADSPFDDSDSRDPLELLKALDAVEADPAISLQPSSEAAAAADDAWAAPDPTADTAAQLEPVPELDTAPEAESVPEVDAVPELEAAPELEAVPELDATPETASVPEVEAVPEPEVQPVPEFAALPTIVQPAPLDESVTMAEPMADPHAVAVADVPAGPEVMALPDAADLAEAADLPEAMDLPQEMDLPEPMALPDPMAGEEPVALDQSVPFDESPFEEPMAFEAPLTAPELHEQADTETEVEVEVARSTGFGTAEEAEPQTGFNTDLANTFQSDAGLDGQFDEVEPPAVTHGPLVAELQANAAAAPSADVLEEDTTDLHEIEADEHQLDAEHAEVQAHGEVETHDQFETHDEAEADEQAEVDATDEAADTDEPGSHDDAVDQADDESDDETEASLTTGDPRELDPGPPSWDGPFVGPTTWDQLSAMAAAIGGSSDEATEAPTETEIEADTGVDAEHDVDAEQGVDAETELDAAGSNDQEQHDTDTETEAPASVEAPAASSASALSATNDIDALFEKLSQLGSSGPVAVLSLSDRNPAAGLTAGFELADELRAVGANVLLIDVRLETPVLDSLFDDGPGSGLAQVMTGDVVLGEAVRNLSGLDGLDLLTVGITDADTAGHLVGPAFQRLLAEARLTYHSIVVIGDALVTGDAGAGEDQDPSAEIERARSLATAVDALIVGTAEPVGTTASDELAAVLDSFDAPTLQLITAPVPAASGTVPEASSV